MNQVCAGYQRYYSKQQEEVSCRINALTFFINIEVSERNKLVNEWNHYGFYMKDSRERMRRCQQERILRVDSPLSYSGGVEVSGNSWWYWLEEGQQWWLWIDSLSYQYGSRISCWPWASLTLPLLSPTRVVAVILHLDHACLVVRSLRLHTLDIVCVAGATDVKLPRHIWMNKQTQTCSCFIQRNCS